jgi:hypothetical protein
MKDHWEKLEIEVLAFKEHLTEMLEMLPQSAKFHTKTGAINKAWTKLYKALNEMDQFITPVKSIEVNCPLLNDPAFRERWNFWKDYLNEQHGIFMRSRAELMALKRLADISCGNAATAIYYLEYAMSKINPNFYKVNEAEEPKTTGPAAQKQFVLKLPDKYQKPVDKLEGLTN